MQYISFVTHTQKIIGGKSARSSVGYKKLKLLDQLYEALNARHYSRRTEQMYYRWVKRFVFFLNVCYSIEISESEINFFPTHLATKEKVNAST